MWLIMDIMSLPDVANDMPAAEHGVSSPKGDGLTQDRYARRWVGFARITAPNAMVNKWRVQLQNMFYFIDRFIYSTYIVNVACRLIDNISFLSKCETDHWNLFQFQT